MASSRRRKFKNKPDNFFSCEDSDDEQEEHKGCNNEMVSKSETFSDDTNWLSALEPFS